MSHLLWSQFTGTRMYRARDGAKIVAVAVRTGIESWSWCLLSGDTTERRAPTLEAAQERAENAYAVRRHMEAA